MKHILEKTKGEQIRTAIMWDLTIYDDVTEEIEERSVMQIVGEERW